MGYIIHHAIVVSADDENAIRRAHAKAEELGCRPTNIVGPVTNFTFTFLVPPDGSKEGWGESKAGDERRKALKEFMGRSYSWIEVAYGGDNGEAYIVNHADEGTEPELW